MAEKLYGLTARTADALRGILGDTGSVGTGPARSGVPARGTTWVKVTGAAVSGWHPAVVSLDLDGTFTDLSTAVEVKTNDGYALLTGVRYLCTRTGDKSDGTARFRVLDYPPEGRWLQLASDQNITTTPTAFLGMTLQPGQWLVRGLWQLKTLTSAGNSKVTIDLYNLTDSTVLRAGPEYVGPTATWHSGTLSLHRMFTLTADKQIYMRVWRDNVATYTSAILAQTGTELTATRVTLPSGL